MGTDQRLTTLRRSLSRARARATLLAQERNSQAFDVLIGTRANKNPRAVDTAVRQTAREVTQLEAEVRAAEQRADTRDVSPEPRS